jgi:CHAT domain-containing protein
LVAPDGALHRVPFAALPLGDQRLGQRKQLRLLTSGRDLLPSAATPEPGPSATPEPGPSLVLADPALGSGWGSAFSGQDNRQAQRREGQAVARLLQVSPITDARASEAVLRRQRAPRLLHIASHGYYLADRAAAGSDPGGMLLSAIALAGASQRREPITVADPGDGHLTAREVSVLNLEGTALTVLSACETGQGAVSTGEAIYGMQRALTLAGSRSSLLALWNVSADATEAFMERYWRKLIEEKKGRLQALVETQAEFRSNPAQNAWRHPRFWAAWQLVGETGPLP